MKTLNKWTAGVMAGGALLGACAESAGSSELAGRQMALYPDQTGFGSCNWINPFSQLPECAIFSGGGWNEADAVAWCNNRLANTVGTFELGGTCDIQAPIGVCVESFGQPTEVFTTFTGTANECGTTENACTGFAQGVWIPEPGGACEDGSGGDGGTGGPNPGALEPEALDAMLSNALVTVAPECLDEACVPALAGSGEWIEFSPTLGSKDIGVVIYGGGNLDPRAYAPAAQAFAAAGYFTAIPPFPGNLAISAPDIASDVRAAHPGISQWVLVGHSLGGVAAISHIDTNPGVYAGIGLWAAFPASNDISDEPIKGLSVYGTIDPLATAAEIEATVGQLPAETVLAPLHGGNHSGFAKHGLKEGDVPVDLVDQNQQFDLAVGATLHLLKRVAAGCPDHVADLSALDAGDAAKGCKLVQRRAANYTPATLPIDQINNTIWPDFRSFWSSTLSTPSVNPDGDPLLNTFQYMKQLPNPDDIGLPPVINGELFCKIRTQEAILDEANDPPLPEGPQRQCAAHNRAVLNRAISRLPWRARRRARRWDVEFADDQVYPTGPRFMFDEDSFIDIETGGARKKLVIRSRAFLAGLDQDVWGSSYGRQYCKVLPRQQAWRLARYMARRGALPAQGGSCSYVNPFSQTAECKAYSGDGWSVRQGWSDCAQVFAQPFPVSGSYSRFACETETAIATCTTDAGTLAAQTTYFYDGEIADLQAACEGFAGGVFESLLPEPELEVVACDYVGQFSGVQECKQYTGANHTTESNVGDCLSMSGTPLTEACSPVGAIGLCVVGSGTDDETGTFIYGGDPAAAAQGCGFAGGSWVAF